MVFAYVPLFCQQLMLLTYLADNLPNSKFHFSCKNMVAVFCHPHKVLLDVVYRVRTFAIFPDSPSKCHHNTIEEEAEAVPPEGEGFYQ